MKEIVIGLTLTLLLTGALSLALDSETARSPETIHIRIDGSVDPPTESVIRDGDVYSFTRNIFGSIELSRSDIIVDGVGYTLQGNGSRKGIDVTSVSGYINVTIRNMKIRAFTVGIELASSFEGRICGNTISNNKDGIRITGFGQYSSFNNTISENTITNNENGIVMEEYDVGSLISGNIITNNNKHGMAFITSMPLHSPVEENIISGNTVLGNGIGIHFISSSNNCVYHNNFADNTVQVFTEDSANVWDDGYPSGGNYWSSHVCNGNPNAGSQPFILDENNTDNYPFQVPNGWIFSAGLRIDGKGKRVLCGNG